MPLHSIWSISRCIYIYMYVTRHIHIYMYTFSIHLCLSQWFLNQEPSLGSYFLWYFLSFKEKSTISAGCMWHGTIATSTPRAWEAASLQWKPVPSQCLLIAPCGLQNTFSLSKQGFLDDIPWPVIWGKTASAAGFTRKSSLIVSKCAKKLVQKCEN